MSGKCGVTSIAGLFVAVWELVLTPCQLAERPIQKKKKKKFPCFYPQNKYPLYPTPRHTQTHTHTTDLAASQRNKGGCVWLSVYVWWRLWGVGQGISPCPGQAAHQIQMRVQLWAHHTGWL